MAKRRGHNEGSVYQRKDGLWTAAVDLGMVNGKRKRKYVYAKTRAEANRKLIALQADIQRGIPVRTTSTTVGAFLDLWLESVKPNIRHKTYVSYESIVRIHLRPSLGNVRIERLTHRQVQEMLNARVSDGLSAQSVIYIRNVLRNALNTAMKWDLVSRNVAALATPPKKEDFKPTILNKSQASRFLAQIHGDRLEAILSLSLSLGLRQAEALGLQWDRVDLEAGTITIDQQLQIQNGQPTFTTPKSAMSQRVLPLAPALIDVLKRHRIRQTEDRLKAGARWQGHWNLVFTTPIGTPIDNNNLRKRFYELLEEAGLPKMRYHDMRHSAASMLAAQGVHPTIAQAILGHANVHTTLGIYSHADVEVMKAAVAMISDIAEAKKEAK